MHGKKWMALTLVAGCLTMACTGCGRDGPERAVVTGKVTYCGEPVKKGIIRFKPTKGTKTPPWGANIIDGRYEAFGKGGVPVGTHKVEIMAWRDAQPKSAQAANDSMDVAGGAISGKQYLPPKYNTRTELEITIEPGSGEVARDFILEE